jgi:hypothetical protein
MSSKELIVNDIKESELIPIIQGEQFKKISEDISACITTIKEQKSNAENAKNLTGRFKGQLRDNALADAMISSADTQNKTITLIQESIKLFFYCLRCQEQTNFLHNEKLFNFIIEQSDDPETNEYLKEILSSFVNYRDANNTKIKTIKDEQDEKILRLKEQIKGLDERANKHNKKYQKIDSKVNNNNDRLTKLEQLNVETRLTKIEQWNVKECLSNQQERIEILESTMSMVKDKNEWLKKTLFWHKIFILLSIVFTTISFFAK